MEKIKVLGNRILVEHYKDEESNKSVIILTETVNKKETSQGKIVAVGNGKKVSQLEFKENDIVFFDTWKGEEIKLNSNGKEKIYRFLEIEDVTAKLY